MRNKLALVLCSLLAMAALPLHAAATIVIVNGDPAGVGFNDATAAAPVGGNAGTTIGEQRLIAFQAAAAKWGATLNSTVVIRIFAVWTALPCTPTSAVLGSAGATEVFGNFPGALVQNHWFGKAEANKLVGEDLDPATPDILANFNVNLGQPNCLSGTFFYLGLDNNHGSSVDLVTVLTHEFAHGLGFQTYTNGSSGARLGGLPSIWDDFLTDTSLGLNWTSMTNAQRAASAVNEGHLVWNGPNVNAAVPQVLAPGTPQLIVNSPSSAAGTYLVGTASFGPPLSSPGLNAEMMPLVDTAPDAGLACNPLSRLNAAAVNGKIAIVDRGICSFNIKAQIAQSAGAIGVIIINNVAGTPPPGLAGTDPTIFIPVVSVSQADGQKLKGALAARSRAHSGLFATLGVNVAVRAGADANGFALLFAPNPFAAGSSVSHWDTSMFPNQLMEPNISSDLTHEVTPPQDLTYPLLKDIGWN
jgi:hypothetical protein